MEEAHDSLNGEGVRMPLTGHLGELRQVLVKALFAIALGFGVVYSFADTIIDFLQRPLLQFFPEGQQFLYFTGITDKFFVYLQVSVLASILLTLPYLLYLTWSFVSPALYEKEQKIIRPFLFLGTLAFIVGVSFGYYVVIPYGYKFLIEFGSSSQRPLITITEYFSLTLKLLGLVGFVFELPVVLIVLGALGLVTPQLLAKLRKQAFLVLIIASAVLTPSPDAFTMMLVAVPLCLLYEISIWGVKIAYRRRQTEYSKY